MLVWGSARARRDGKEIEADSSVLSDGEKCASSGCHDLLSGSMADGMLSLQGLPASWKPGQAYTLTLSIASFSSIKEVYGFQAAALTGDGSQAGTLTPLVQGAMINILDSIPVLTHSPEPLETSMIPFRWTAPAAGAGAVTLHLAGNAANDNSDPSGDHVGFLAATVPEAVPVPLEESYFGRIGDGVFADIRFQTTLILLNTGPESEVELDLFLPDGQPMVLDLETLGVGSSFDFSLGTGESLSVQSAGTSALQVGYARFRAGQGVGGTAIFTRSDTNSGVLLFETGVPASKPLAEFSFFADQQGVRRTGLALVNPGSQTVTITMKLYDQDFVQAASPAQIVLAPAEHQAAFVDEFFTLPMGFEKGIVAVQASAPVVATALRQNDDEAVGFPLDVPALTAFPVTPGVPQQL